MTRRLLLFLPLAACLRADAEKDAIDLLASAANGLSAGRPEQFLEAFDPSLPGFDKLQSDVRALIDAAELTCSLGILSNEGGDAERTLSVDWILQLAPKGDNPVSMRRQKTVKCRLRKVGKKWRIVEFEPLELFAPPRAG